MCQTKILHHSSVGCVTYCYHCEGIQVIFGTTALRLSQEQFESFYDYLSNFFPKYDRDCCTKRIMIPVTEHAVAMLLTGAELYQLHQLLEEAHNALGLVKLLKNLPLN
ncbi:MAG: DUF6686 family protein [Thermoflexibacteraceae bacterium]|jgi:hypothetical protein